MKKKPERYLYLVTLPKEFVYGVVVEEERIVYAPPIVKWAIGGSLESFRKWVKGKGGNVK